MAEVCPRGFLQLPSKRANIFYRFFAILPLNCTATFFPVELPQCQSCCRAAETLLVSSRKLADVDPVCFIQALNSPPLLHSPPIMAATSVPNRPLPLDEKYDHYDYPTDSATVLSGHPGHTTPEQDAQVHQLRTELERAGYTERLDTLTLVRLHLALPQCNSSHVCSCEHIVMETNVGLIAPFLACPQVRRQLVQDHVSLILPRRV